MSGIFGFTLRQAEEQTLADTIGGLHYWNKMYGNTVSGQLQFHTSGIGIHVEHFSEDFPYGGPLFERDGSHAVVDALLYNRDELLPLLGNDADPSISDEALLLKLIDRKGFDVLKLVNGDFAGAVWDDASGNWILFRDHMGVRPLFYYHDRDRLVFSTDMRGIAAVPGVDTSVNRMQLYKYITRINSLNIRDTDFQHIRCIHPGSVCRIRMTEEGFAEQETIYWRPGEGKIRFSSDDEYRAELRRLVTDSVHRRCDAIPGLLGAELSGGLDSTIIDILINRHGREAVYYSWSPDPDRYPLQDGEDERKVILDVCEQEGISCRFLHMEERVNTDYTVKELMPPYVNTLQLTYGSRWMKSQGANVVFTGHGGDEGVSHRASRFELFYNREYPAYFKMYWKDLEGKPLRHLRGIRAGWKDGMSRMKDLRDLPTYEQFHPDLLRRDFCDEMSRTVDISPNVFSVLPSQYVRSGGTRNRLDNGAFQGAYCGVRYLFPYVDHRVMDFAVSIPRRLYLKGRINRLIFRETFADLMPESLRQMHYKDMASSRTRDKAPAQKLSHHRRAAYLLEKLDRERWSGILDFEALENLRDNDKISSDDIGRMMLTIYKLETCIYVQAIQDEARNWRERENG